MSAAERAIASALRDLDDAPVRLRAVGGGDISQAYAIDTHGGRRVFAKYRPGAPDDFFMAEIEGLDALRQPLWQVPQPLAHRREVLLLAWVTLHNRTERCDAALGVALATLHQAPAPGYGWVRDNYIGATPQANRRHDEWANFFWSERIRPQLQALCAAGVTLPDVSLERVEADVHRCLAGHSPRPSLLHGDLWSGNAAATADGAPFVFDPACYWGDRETDLAMCELFGGFSDAFWSAYQAHWPLDPGYTHRRQLYQLYHWLNHANLFGGGYVTRAVQTLARLHDS